MCTLVSTRPGVPLPFASATRPLAVPHDSPKVYLPAMPIGKVLKVNVGKNSELSQYFLEDDPEAIFIDQREIGHGSFGAVYYVSRPYLSYSCLSMDVCVLETVVFSRPSL